MKYSTAPVECFILPEVWQEVFDIILISFTNQPYRIKKQKDIFIFKCKLI
jgi:hypothetical protein